MNQVGRGGPCGRWAALAIAMLPILLQGAPQAEARAVSRGRSTLFDRLSGSWTGIGAAGPTVASAERIACRVDYTPSAPARLHLTLQCASPSYRIRVDGDLARDGDRIDGTLQEQSFGVSGSLTGTVGADRLQAVVSGLGLSALLSLTMQGGVQAVTLQGLGTLSAGASVRLRRATA